MLNIPINIFSGVQIKILVSSVLTRLIISGILSYRMAYVCFWLVMLIHNYLEQHWILKLAVFTIQCICKVCVTCVSMYYLRDLNNILTTVIAAFFLNAAEVLTLLPHLNTQTFILTFHQNTFPKRFKDLSPSLLILSSARLVSKTSWRQYRVNMKKIDMMMFGEQIRYGLSLNNVMNYKKA